MLLYVTEKDNKGGRVIFSKGNCIIWVSYLVRRIRREWISGMTLRTETEEHLSQEAPLIAAN